MGFCANCKKEINKGTAFIYPGLKLYDLGAPVYYRKLCYDFSKDLEFCDENCFREFLVKWLQDIDSYYYDKDAELANYSIPELLNVIEDGDKELSCTSDNPYDEMNGNLKRIREYNQRVKIFIEDGQLFLTLNTPEFNKKYIIDLDMDCDPADFIDDIRKLCTVFSFQNEDEITIFKDLFGDSDTIHCITEKSLYEQYNGIADWAHSINAKSLYVGQIANVRGEDEEADILKKELQEELPGVQIKEDAITSLKERIYILGA